MKTFLYLIFAGVCVNLCFIHSAGAEEELLWPHQKRKLELMQARIQRNAKIFPKAVIDVAMDFLKNNPGHIRKGKPLNVDRVLEAGWQKDRDNYEKLNLPEPYTLFHFCFEGGSARLICNLDILYDKKSDSAFLITGSTSDIEKLNLLFRAIWKHSMADVVKLGQRDYLAQTFAYIFFRYYSCADIDDILMNFKWLDGGAKLDEFGEALTENPEDPDEVVPTIYIKPLKISNDELKKTFFYPELLFYGKNKWSLKFVVYVIDGSVHWVKLSGEMGEDCYPEIKSVEDKIVLPKGSTEMWYTWF